MNRLLRIFTLLCVAGCLFVTSCSPRYLAQQPTAQQALFDYYFAEGERQRIMGNHDAAFAMLSEAARIDTLAPEAQYALANYYLQLDRPDTAIYMLRKAAEGDTSQYWYNTTYARITSYAQMYDETERILKRLIRHNPDKPELYSAIATNYVRQGNPAAALAYYDSLELSMGLNEVIIQEKIALREQLRDTAGIIAEAQRIQKAFPTNTTYMLKLGNMYLQYHLDSCAWEMFNKVEILEPHNGALLLSKAAYYEQQGDSAAYHSEMKAALNNPNLDVDTKMGIFRNYISALINKNVHLQDLDTLYMSMVEQYPQEALIRQLYSYYLWITNNYSKAKEQYSIAVDLDPNEATAWKQYITLYMIDKEFDKVISEGRRALQYIPKDPLIYEMVASALVQQERYDEAIELLLNAVEQCQSGDSKQLSILYGQLGDVYHILKRNEECYAQYEKALGYNALNLVVLNNYSYFLAQENRDLSKAERMSARTIRELPDEPTYLDTYAWILFKKGDYSFARIYIERALEKNKEPSAEILEHYGDILFKTGDADAAVEQWKKALEVLEEKSTTLEKKIELREYIE